MRQFAFNLWTINIQAYACLLTFTFFLPNSGAQMCNIEGHHHRCAQLLTKAAVLCARTLKSKMEGEASQTTAKSKWSRFKQEMGNTTCLAVAFACAAQPSSTGNIPRIFTANSSVWKLLKYLLNPQAAEWGLFNPWTFISSFKPWFPFPRCHVASENSEATKTRNLGSFSVAKG